MNLKFCDNFIPRQNKKIIYIDPGQMYFFVKIDIH
jgi:hypothetical protein